MPLMIIAVFAAVILTSCDKPDPDDDPTTNVSTGSTSSDDTNKSNKMWVVSSCRVKTSEDYEAVENFSYDSKGRIVRIDRREGDRTENTIYTYSANAIYERLMYNSGSVQENSCYTVEDGLIVDVDGEYFMSYAGDKINKLEYVPDGLYWDETTYNWDGDLLLGVISTSVYYSSEISYSAYDWEYVSGSDLNDDCIRFINSIAMDAIGDEYYLWFSGAYGKVPSGAVFSRAIRTNGKETTTISYSDVDADGCPATIVTHYKEDGEGDYFRFMSLTWRQITIE